jgi:glycosyltransferase involved in cell wall biosynthesis
MDEKVSTKGLVGPRVSIVIPSYNRARYLPEALGSVFSQTYQNIEVILVDDGSTDDTQKVIQPYLNKIKFVKKINGGLASARNVGMRYATGDYIAMMDSDDICTPDRIAKQVGYLELNRDVVLCSSDFSAFNGKEVTERSHIRSYYSAVDREPDGVRGLYQESEVVELDAMPWSANTSQDVLNVSRGHVYDVLIWGNFIHPPTLMVRREVSEKVGEFDQSLTFATDYDWILRVSRHGKLAYIDEPLLKYRYSADQMSSDRNLAKIIYETIMVMDKLLEVDPAIVARHQARFSQRVGSCYQGLAYALCQSDKTGALASLLRSIRYGVVDVQTLKLLAKIVMPRALLARLKALTMAICIYLHDVDGILDFVIL